MTHLSTNLVLTLNEINDNAGRICFDNVVTSGSISATSAAAGSPITNATNPATAFVWAATSTATQTITITNGSRRPIDYIGIARHNLNQVGLNVDVSFDGTLVYRSGAIGQEQALLFLFSQATPATITLSITGATTAPTIAVIYAGLSLRLERNIYVGHTPITMGRERTAINGISQSGEYLGEVILNKSLTTGVSLQNLTPFWYRQNLDPFFAQSPRPPCFWAWRPKGYPAEVGYCWVEGNPRPTNQRSNGMMQVDWNFRGIA
jgi:hypothetical protein